jgi:hypothetical protein
VTTEIEESRVVEKSHVVEESYTVEQLDAKDPVSATALWFSAVAGPIAWALHNVGSYVLSTSICIPGQDLLLHAVTVVLGLITLVAAFVGWRARNRARDAEWPPAGYLNKRRAIFMANYGVISSLLFFLVILVEGIPTFYLDPCHTMG